MNDQQFAQEVRNSLEESSARLPYRVTHRLEQARNAALARQRTTEVQVVSRPVNGGAATLGGSHPGESGHPLWWRLGMTALPVLLVAAGLMVISVWNDTEQADEIVEIDSAVLTDEVPLSAYTDRGFGVFLKNSRQ